MSVDRLIRQKRRLTRQLHHSDLRQINRARPVKPKRWIRTRIYRIDLLLERKGLMPTATWYPGATRKPGLNANYRRGRVLARCVKEHITVGTNSGSLIQNRGLAQFLINADGTVDQYAPADAVCADSCEWAIEGPGIENERLAVGQLNAPMIRANGALHAWLVKTYGYPPRWYGGARRLEIGNPEGYGFVNHGSLIHRKCDMHSDGITAAEWTAILAAADQHPPLAEKDEPRMFTIDGNTVYWFVAGKPAGARFRKVTADERLKSGKGGVALAFISADTFRWMNT